MYKIRLWATILLVALCTGFYSCGGDDEDEKIPDNFNPLGGYDSYFIKYGIIDYKDIEIRLGGENDEYAYFSGLKNNRLWLASFDTETKQKQVEWTDTEECNRERKLDLGYGEYENVTLSYIIPIYYTSNNNFVVILDYRFGNSGNNDALREHYAIFKYNSSTKKINLGKYNNSNKGYKDSFFIGNCCYTQTGDTIYVAPKFYNVTRLMVSYEEGIEESTASITRYNYKEGEIIWNTSIKPPFEVPSDARSTITLLDNSTNIWKYRVDYTFYDGTKKEHTFSINIDNGEIQ